jgi:glycerate kinase
VFVPTTALGLSSVTPPPVPSDVARLRERAAAADLVVVHTAVLDAGTLHDGAVAEAARAAEPHAVPVVVLAGRDESSRREWSAAGLSGVHEVGDEPLEVVPRVARTWSPAWA